MAQKARQLSQGHTLSKRECGILNTRKKASLIHTTHRLSLAVAYLPLWVSKPSAAPGTKQEPRVCCLKVIPHLLRFYFYTVCIWTSYQMSCSEPTFISWSQQDWTSLFIDFTLQHRSFVTEAFFIHTHKKSQGSACFCRTYTKIWTIQGGLITSMTPAKRWCAHLWWFHICKKHPNRQTQRRTRSSLCP